MRYPFFLLALSLFLTACQTNTDPSSTHGNANHLIDESSPYLLQHAYNPVDWYPWGEEALQKAQEENKLLLISVGYAACHWCHVMEHESFEDTTVARIMNEHFVSIKVDREERPDVDDVYMSACQLASEKGCGWPLNAFALPDGRPVWAGTYFPKKQWQEILEYFAKEYATSPDKMAEYAQLLTEGIANTDLAPVTEDISYTEDQLAGFADGLTASMDRQKGGRKGAPKFPMPDIHRFLLDYHHYTQDSTAIQVVKTSLDEMAKGGIYDHLGGGFARYSTDNLWLVPHFEKMLYDNGQLVSLYAQAYAATGKERYAEVVRETLAFVERELMGADGNFYSSLDADSEGEEGKFYVWTQAEIDSLLSPEEAKIITDFYQTRDGGNWEDEKNILHQKVDLSAFAAQKKVELKETRERLASARKKLLAARANRTHPGLDDKALTAWNALMITGYADAYAALGEVSYLETALKSAQFLEQALFQNEQGQLFRNYKDGEASINAFLDDYAHLSMAFIRLYEVTFDEHWLQQARLLTDYALAHFQQEAHPLLYYTSDLDPPLVTRRLDIDDNVIGSSNAVFARALFFLGTYLYEETYLERSQAMLAAIQEKMLTSPEAASFFTHWGRVALLHVHPPYEVAIVGSNWKEVQQALLQKHLPQAILLGGADEGTLELLKNKSVEGETFIYVCQNKICKLPVQEAEAALELMK